MHTPRATAVGFAVLLIVAGAGVALPGAETQASCQGAGAAVANARACQTDGDPEPEVAEAHGNAGPADADVIVVRQTFGPYTFTGAAADADAYLFPVGGAGADVLLLCFDANGDELCDVDWTDADVGADAGPAEADAGLLRIGFGNNAYTIGDADADIHAPPAGAGAGTGFLCFDGDGDNVCGFGVAVAGAGADTPVGNEDALLLAFCFGSGTVDCTDYLVVGGVVDSGTTGQQQTVAVAKIGNHVGACAYGTVVDEGCTFRQVPSSLP